MRRKELLARISRGALGNVGFADFQRLIEGFGFRLLRSRGSHFVYARSGIPNIVNLQEVGGQAKPYQIRQFLRIVERYNLKMEDDA